MFDQDSSAICTTSYRPEFDQFNPPAWPARARAVATPPYQERTLNEFTLYGTEACHLCDVAQAMVVDVLRAGAAAQVEVVDIAQSDALYTRYAIRIPVLAHPDGRELDWPFPPEALRLFLTS